MSVEAARVGQNPHPRAGRRRRLRAGDRAGVAERGPVGGDAGDGQDAGAVAVDESGQPVGAGLQFGGGELGGLRAGPGHQVGDAQAVAGQQVLLGRGQQARSEPGQVQGRPEPVARAGEMPAGRGGVQAGVDAAEEHPEQCPRRREDIGDRTVPGRLQVRRARARGHRG